MARQGLVTLSLATFAATAWAEPVVEVSGVNSALRDNVLAFIGLDEQPCDAPRWQLQRRLRDIDGTIGNALKPFGYYAPVIEKSIQFGEDCWSATLAIEPGPRVLWRDVTVIIDGPGEAAPGVAAIIAAAPKPGAPLAHADYESVKQRLRQTLMARGYLETRFDEAALNIYPYDLVADMRLQITSGERYRLGAIRIEQDVIEPDLIRRYVRLQPGDPFERRALDRLQADLAATAYFDRVIVRADYEQAEDGRVPVSVELTPADNLGYFIGVGASTDQGPRFRGGYRNRLVNTRGHQFESGALYSPVLSQLNAVYRQPLENPLAEWQTIELLFEKEDTDTSVDRRVRAGIERTLELSNDWLFRYGISAGQSNYTVSDVSNTARLIMPVVGFTRRVADDPSNPRSGSAIEWQMQGAARGLASSTDFVQAYLRYRKLIPVGERGRFSLRAEAGVTWQDEFDDLPPSVRFFAGGDNSVRGYGYQQIGPENDLGEVIGGSQLITASIEYEHTIRGPWGIAAFVDSGNAFDDANINPRTGVGLGLVWRSPVGPLRAYLAHPLDDTRSVRLHINFGVDL